jgi:hypothetical protein
MSVTHTPSHGSFRFVVAASFAAACLSLSLATPAWCQYATQQPLPPRISKTLDLSGPRFGLTMLSPGNVDALKKEHINVRPMISQFGWQFERRFYSKQDGMTALTEWVPLISGLEQGVVLPSLNWLVGVRTSTGAEFGIGPNITPLGVGLVIAAGVTVRSGALNIPLNFAIASSKSGSRVTIMTGFNIRK